MPLRIYCGISCIGNTALNPNHQSRESFGWLPTKRFRGGGGNILAGKQFRPPFRFTSAKSCHDALAPIPATDVSVPGRPHRTDTPPHQTGVEPRKPNGDCNRISGVPRNPSRWGGVEMRSPIEQMIDRACGYTPSDTGHPVIIILACPHCLTQRSTTIDASFPPETRRVQYPCPTCQKSHGETIEFFDGVGRRLKPEWET